MLISHYLQEEEEKKKKNTKKKCGHLIWTIDIYLYQLLYSVPGILWQQQKYTSQKNNDSVFSISLQSTVFRLRQLKPHFMLQNLFPLLYDPPLLLAMIAAPRPQPTMPSEFITIGFYHILEAYERSNERLVVMSRGLDSVGSQ